MVRSYSQDRDLAIVRNRQPEQTATVSGPRLGPHPRQEGKLPGLIRSFAARESHNILHRLGLGNVTFDAFQCGKGGFREKLRDYLVLVSAARGS